jgi:hypothetical protein
MIPGVTLRPPFLIALLLAAASTPFAVAAATQPIVKDGLQITILPTMEKADGAQTRQSGGVFNVTLDMEAQNDDAAHRLGFRSLRSVTAIDCRQGANRFVEAEAYPEAGLMGQGAPRTVSGKWVRPAEDSYMAQVLARVCVGGAPAPAAATAAPKYADSGPLPVVVNTGQAEASDHAVPPPATTRVTRRSAAPTAHAYPPPPAPPAQLAARPAVPGVRAVAQVAASSSAKDAQHVLNQLRAQITPPLTGSVEPAVVNNAHLFRASVSGFSSMEAAKAFCARAASVSKTCWVHR